VVAVEAYCLLHLFDTGLSAPPGESVLSESEIEMLEAPRESKSSRDWSTATLQPTDWPLVQALAADGRATYRQLAVLTHWHESTVRRRVEELTASGALFLQVDLAFGVFGIHSTALLWMSVVPAGLTAVGEALARCPEIPFVAATTGSTNLLAALICEDDRSLYDFLNNELAGHEGLTHIEISPVMRTIKLHATMTPPHS
jgi:DNA-binding Lrp family transcriptional regulator